MASSNDLFQSVLRPGGLSFLFQPLLELCRQGPVLYGIECFARGPKGTPLESADSLFEFARALGREPEIDRACVLGALGGAALLSSRISINVHAATLSRDLDFVPWLLVELDKRRFPSRRLTLDLVAPQLAPCTGALLGALSQLRASGISIAVDDVGLNTNDFHGILTCRPDYVKLDRGLVHRSSHDEIAAAMLDSLARLSRTVGAQPMAEGVETVAELDSVAELGLCLVQGYLFCPPLRLEELVRSELFASDGTYYRPTSRAS